MTPYYEWVLSKQLYDVERSSRLSLSWKRVFGRICVEDGVILKEKDEKGVLDRVF